MFNLVTLASISPKLLQQSRRTKDLSYQWNYFGIDGTSTVRYMGLALFLAVVAFIILMLVTKRLRAKKLSKGSKYGLYVIIALFTLGAGFGSYHVFAHHACISINRNAKFSKPAQHAYEDENLTDTKIHYKNEEQQLHGDFKSGNEIKSEIKSHKIPSGQHKLADIQLNNLKKNENQLHGQIKDSRQDLNSHQYHKERRPGTLDLFRYL